MSDRFGPGDITSGHPTTRNLSAAPDPEPVPRGPLSATFPLTEDQPADDIAYGPGDATESQLRLLGSVDGRRLLVLGLGVGAATVALARAGARVIGVDPSLARIEATRSAAEAAEVKVELHQSDLAELPFVRADSLDGALSVLALAAVDDLDRVFCQVHRVLHPETHLVLSVPHPAYVMLDADADEPAVVVAPYFERRARAWVMGGEAGQEHHRTMGDLFTSLSRANFRVDTVAEPEPTGAGGVIVSGAERWAPAVLVLRARKEGI